MAVCLANEQNDYQQILRDDCLETGARLGFAIRVASADGDPEKQVAQIEAFLAGHAAEPLVAILVSPVRENVLTLGAFDAVRAGIAWVVLNRSSEYLEPLRRDYPQVPIFSVTPDQEEIGRIQARQFRRILPQGGEVLYVQGARRTSSAQLRLRGVQEVLEGSAITLTIGQGDWSPESGDRAVRRWARGIDPQRLRSCVVGAQNDAMALGASQALAAVAVETGHADLAPIPVTGVDASPAFGRRLVDEGTLTATVALPSVGGPALEALGRVRDAGTLPPAEIRLPVTSLPSLDKIAARR